jgi:hypothetical protein
MVFRVAMAEPRRLRLALTPRLASLPSPAQALRLTVEGFGPPVSDQRALLDEATTGFAGGAPARNARLREAVAQAHAAAGPDAALRVVTVDPDSRVPERRTMLAPYRHEPDPPARP